MKPAEHLRAGEVVVIDVRPRVEFAAGHIQGARSVPLDNEDRLAEIPDDAEVVAYCRGPYCVYAHEAVRRLQAAGRRARRLEDGWPEWRLAGLPRGGRSSACDPGKPLSAPRQEPTGRSSMRAIDCPCGHRLEAPHDGGLHPARA